MSFGVGRLGSSFGRLGRPGGRSKTTSFPFALGGVLPSHDINFISGRAYVNGVDFITPKSLITFNGSAGGAGATITGTGLQIGATDVVTLTTPPTFGSAYSLIVWGTPTEPIAFGTSQVLVQIDDGSTNNRLILLRAASVGTAQFNSTSAATAQTGGGTVWAQNAMGKLAASDAASSQIGVFNSGTPSTKSGALPVGVTTMRIGSSSSGASQWNGGIARIIIFPTTALNAALLQQATTL